MFYQKATGLFQQQIGPVRVEGYNDDVISIDASQRGVIIKLGSVTIEFKNTLIRVTVPGILKNQVIFYLYIKVSTENVYNLHIEKNKKIILQNNKDILLGT